MGEFRTSKIDFSGTVDIKHKHGIPYQVFSNHHISSNIPSILNKHNAYTECSELTTETSELTCSLEIIFKQARGINGLLLYL